MCLWTWDVHRSSNLLFSIPMNCNHWNLFLLLRSVPVFLVGRFMPFKSAHWTFFKLRC
nr:MAG TPA: hypothetical protein [Caudoviricetes sp.]